jgi:hypothetical protein
MAIGDLVATISFPGVNGTETYLLASNPGGWFAISGNTNLVQAISTPNGVYPITIMAIGPLGSVSQMFILTFTGAPLLQSEPIPIIF